MLPYFKRSEDNEPPARRRTTDSAGPLNVVDPVWVSSLADRFVASAGQLGVPANDDFNGAEQEGAGVVQVTQKRGRRWSAADAFLHPVRKERDNLDVVTGAQAQPDPARGRRARSGSSTTDGGRRADGAGRGRGDPVAPAPTTPRSC